MDKSKNIYYGTDDIKSLSYLEFGSIDLKNAKKKIWAYWHDQEAYDLYMFARYARDLFTFRDFFEEKDYSLEKFVDCVKRTAHDKVYDYIFKYAGMMSYIQSGGVRPVCESGSSLYGFIEEVEALDYVVNHGDSIEDIKNMKYVASDISDMMNKGATIFHPDIEISSSTAGTISELLDENRELGLFYGLSVSLRYAFRSSKDIKKVTECCEMAIFNRLSMSYKGDTNVLAGTGKEAYVLSVDEMKAIFKEADIKVLYNTDSIQINRDGEDTIRASMIICKNRQMTDLFVDIYNKVVHSLVTSGVISEYTGEWKEFSEL